MKANEVRTMELDNKKMWESLIRECDNSHDQSISNWIFNVRSALADQGLQYNSGTKKIESIKPDPFKLEKGKWYVCMEDIYDHVTDDVIFKEGELFNVFAITPRVRTINNHFKCIDKLFRPATPEEIPHSESEQEELNEFEKWFKKLIGCYASAMGTPLIEQPEDRQNDFVKKHAQSLLSIARKQIASEINVDEMVQKFKDGVKENPHGILACLTLNGAYKLGMDDTLKAIKGE